MLVATYSSNGTTATGVAGQDHVEGNGHVFVHREVVGRFRGGGRQVPRHGQDEGLADPQHGHHHGRDEQGRAVEGNEVQRVALHSRRGEVGKTTTITEYLLPGSKIAI